MEEKAAGAGDEVPDEADQENWVMFLLDAVYYPAQAEEEEGEVREGVDYLGGIDGCVVVLDAVSVRRKISIV